MGSVAASQHVSVSVRLSRFLPYAVIVPAWLLATCPAAAQSEQRPTVYFDHRAGQVAASTLYVEDGDIFTIAIENTCESRFAYDIRSIRQEEPRPTQASVPKGSLSVLLTKRMDVVHNDTYAGYFVDVTERPTPPAAPCTEGTGLASTTFVVLTPKRGWALSFSGGFTVSGLRDPVYGLDAENKLADDPGKMNDARPGIATFVHMYDQRWSWQWTVPMFGLGIRDSNQPEYYFGVGARLGDKATVNGGLVLGPVSRLPGGVRIGQAAPDDKVLTDLPTRMVPGWFVGISYSFIGGGEDELRRPFAGSGGGGG